jgi:hypothetical protein
MKIVNNFKGVNSATNNCKLMDCVIASFGKEDAELALKGNQENRPEKLGAQQSYAADMLSDNWDLNGETLKFSKTGRLLDGQNRLKAILIASKKSPTIKVKFVVMTGLSNDMFRNIDSGVKRSTADAVGILKRPNKNIWAPALKYVYGFYKMPTKFKDLLHGDSFSEITTNVVLDFDRSLSQEDVIEFTEAVTLGAGANKKKKYGVRCNAPRTACLAYLWSKKYGANIVEKFFRLLSTGEINGVGLGKALEPTVFFAGEILDEMVKDGGNPSKLRQAAVIINAFHLYRKKEKVGSRTAKQKLIWDATTPFPAVYE